MAHFKVCLWIDEFNKQSMSVLSMDLSWCLATWKFSEKAVKRWLIAYDLKVPPVQIPRQRLHPCGKSVYNSKVWEVHSESWCEFLNLSTSYSCFKIKQAMSASYTKQISNKWYVMKLSVSSYWGVHSKWKINDFISCYLKCKWVRMN